MILGVGAKGRPVTQITAPTLAEEVRAITAAWPGRKIVAAV